MKNSNEGIDILFVLDNDSTFLLGNKIFGNIAFNAYELETKLKEGQKLDAVIILAEVDFNESHAALFQGFEVANHLRRKYRLICPLIITSTFKQEVFEHLSRKSPQSYNILYGSGTSFLPVKYLYNMIRNNELENYIMQRPGISNAVLEDTLEMLLQQKGFIIDKITHDLKFSLDGDKVLVVLENIASYLTSSQKSKMGFDRLVYELVKSANRGNETNFNTVKQRLVNICSQHLSTTEYSRNVKEKSTDQMGRLLIVEDDPEQRKMIEIAFQDTFEIHSTGISGEAIKILESDRRNEIVGIIADWRMLKYKDGIKTDYWQDFQGYQVLEHASRTHFAALISLTAEHDKNVHQIRNHLGVSIQLFKKEHIYANEDNAQWQMFVEIVREKCHEVISIISSIPSAANWRKYAKEYREIRLSVQWYTFEQNVIKQANLYWEYFKDSLDLQTRPNINKGLQDVLPLNTLKNVLIGRRLFFILYYEFVRLRNDSSVSFPPEQVIRVGGVERGSAVLDTFAVLRNNWWDPDVSDDKGAFERYNQQAKNLLKALCIKSEEIDQMFPEEKFWLKLKGVNFSI